MIDFNGWVILTFSTDGEDEDTAESGMAIQALKLLVNQLRNRGSFPFIEAHNGYYHLHLAGSANHKGQDWQETLDLLHRVAATFPGAYGTVYLRDDEDPEGQDNTYFVYVVRRGTVERRLDTFLSPCNPVIEE